MQQCDHEKLDAYGIAIDFVIAAEAIAEGATRAYNLLRIAKLVAPPA